MIYAFDLISTIYPSHHDAQQNISHCHWGSKVEPSPNPSLWCMRCLNVHPLSGATSSLPAVFARLPRKPWIWCKKKPGANVWFFFTGMNGDWTIESMNLILEYAHFSPWNLKHWISPTRMRCTPSPNKAIKSGKDMARKVDDLLLELYKTSLFTG